MGKAAKREWNWAKDKREHYQRDEPRADRDNEVTADADAFNRWAQGRSWADFHNTIAMYSAKRWRK